jgi:hypothetical protein
MISQEERAQYCRAMVVLRKLILLGERHIPSGPAGAYLVEDDIRAYVNHLEREISRLQAAIEITEERHQEYKSAAPEQWLKPPLTPTCGIGEPGGKQLSQCGAQAHVTGISPDLRRKMDAEKMLRSLTPSSTKREQ